MLYSLKRLCGVPPVLYRLHNDYVIASEVTYTLPAVLYNIVT